MYIKPVFLSTLAYHGQRSLGSCDGAEETAGTSPGSPRFKTWYSAPANSTRQAMAMVTPLSLLDATPMLYHTLTLAANGHISSKCAQKNRSDPNAFCA